MRRLILACLLALLAAPAAADMYQDGSNAKLPQAQFNLGTQAVGNPASFDLLCDGRETDATIAAGTAHDCSGAINSAAASLVNGATVNVQLQPGKYYLTNTINLATGQTLIGAGRSKTSLRVRDTFSPTAQGVIIVTGGEFAGGVRDLTITFDQPSTQGSRAAFQLLGSCTSSTGGTGCKYPPAILHNGGRGKLENIRIERAWDGIAGNHVGSINSPNGSGNGLWFMNYVEMSALNTGLWMDGSLDQTTIQGFHFWDFAINSATPLYTGVYKDGNVDCMRLGNVDGFSAVNVFCHGANVHTIDSLLPGLGPPTADFTNLSLDSGGRLIVDKTDILNIVNFSASSAPGMAWATPPKCVITIGADPASGIGNTDRVLMTNVFMPHLGDTGICVYGGSAQMENVRVINFVDKPSVIVDGGSLWLRDAAWGTSGVNPRTAPVIKQVSGTLVLVGNSMTGPSAGGGGVAVELTTNGSHSISSSAWGGYGMSFGCGPTTAGYCFGAVPAGLYDMPDYAFPMTATPSLTGTTDFAPVNVSASGNWWLRGNMVNYWLRTQFDSNAYTTGNNFQIATLMPPSATDLGLSRFCGVNTFDKLVWTQFPNCGLSLNTAGTALNVIYQAPVSGGIPTNIGRTSIPASTAGFKTNAAGFYPIR